MKESKMAGGRIAVYVPDHPKANNRGYILRARYVMEKKVGRKLRSNENVHHINGDITDDREENLGIMSRSGHSRHHKENCRKLDYDLIRRLRESGLGYKKIMKATGYPCSSIRSAIKIIMGATRFST